ncbi:MAG: H-NS family nucleoid-associated regulatory protein [Burkholderiales bacterium]
MYDDLSVPAEKLAAIRTIRKLMDFWQIDPYELRGVVVRPAPAPAPAQPALRYRHPISGDAWDGRGSQPDWLRAALLREGYTVDELRACAAAADAT